jgi:hypothetical protein
MKLTRRRFAGLTLSGAALPRAALADGLTPARAQRAAMFGTSSEFRAAMQYIQARGDLDMVAGLLLSLRFSRVRGPQIAETLTSLTGRDHFTDWFEWMLWQEANPQITATPPLRARCICKLIPTLTRSCDQNSSPAIALAFG